MNAVELLIEQHKFGRGRLMATLADIEKSGHATEALHWMMPFGKGRAHMAWQMLHCAATMDRYLNVRILGGEPSNPQLIADYASGSVCRADLLVGPEEIRERLEEVTLPYYQYFLALDPSRWNEKPNPQADRTHFEMLMLISWHEAHHQGQCHIIWNSFKTTKS